MSKLITHSNNKQLKLLIELLIKDYDFAMTPDNPESTADDLDLFDYFKSVNKDLVYKSLIDKHNDCEDTNFEFALNAVKHHKGLFNHFDDKINFEIYRKIKPWLDDESKKQFKIHFYKEYGKEILNGEASIIDAVDNGLIQHIFENDLELYMKVAKKLKTKDVAKKIFEKYPESIFTWFNMSDDVYTELKKFNNPKYILGNMNGKLNTTDDALKFVIEFAEPNLELFLSIKRNLGIKRMWELSNTRLNASVYIDLVESLEDLIFVINIPNISLKSLEDILNKTKDNFPNIYDNLNSLLFVKKEFNNK